MLLHVGDDESAMKVVRLLAATERGIDPERLSPHRRLPRRERDKDAQEVFDLRPPPSRDQSSDRSTSLIAPSPRSSLIQNFTKPVLAPRPWRNRSFGGEKDKAFKTFDRLTDFAAREQAKIDFTVFRAARMTSRRSATSSS